MQFCQQTQKTPKNITWSQLNHAALSKQLTVCTRQDLGREQSILLYVTVPLDVSHYQSLCKQEGQHPLTGQHAPPISGGT